MPSVSTDYDVDFFTNAISIAEDIIRKLKKDDMQKKLDTIEMLNDLPKLPRDKESKQLMIYKEANKVYKDLYIAVARAIMFILDSTFAGIHDETDSYNYALPSGPIAAAEAIKLLPNAFVGGPIKSAINSNDPYVQMIAIEYFESLPSDIRISEIFPKDFNLLIKRLKPKVMQRFKKVSH
jgi:hypothetical protein